MVIESEIMTKCPACNNFRKNIDNWAGSNHIIGIRSYSCPCGRISYNFENKNEKEYR